MLKKDRMNPLCFASFPVYVVADIHKARFRKLSTGRIFFIFEIAIGSGNLTCKEKQNVVFVNDIKKLDKD